ncbi:MAG: 30S ribosomal protein S6--L-glutamate ligase, partial [Algoriphagus sp.]|nr:30S ribosomal protein S6--L-glutamate ligase [Algoriphagus sp.]
QSLRGPLILEVNSSPGLEGIESATGVNIAAEIVKFVEEGVRKKSSKREKH